MRSSLFALLISSALFLHADVTKKISDTQSKLHTKKVQEQEISARMRQLAKEIESEKSKLKRLSQQVGDTKKSIAKLKKRLNLKSSELKKMQNLYSKLKKREEEVNRKLSALLSQEIAISMIQEGGGQEDMHNAFEINSDEVVFKEVLQTYRKLLKNKFSSTKARFEKLHKNRRLIQTQIEKINKRLTTLQNEQKKLAKLERLQKATLQNLHKKEKQYRYKLARIHSEKKSLSRLLQKLKITKKREEKRREETRIVATETNVKVRQIGSSYQKGRVVHYKGPKTIAPLDGYKIVQKFGTFVDPIYKIKIFNDSIKLKPTKNTMVRNILPGKVVYASKAPMMGYVVIVEHPHSLHTIYANLNKLAPKLKIGTKLKAGHIIGRVKDTLTFEVTKNENHINPVELFKR
jgi:murein DD-endopeptidase MepM/ murein hydrolase activator NlpD